LDFGAELEEDPLGAILINGLKTSWNKLSGSVPSAIITEDAAVILEATLRRVLILSEMHWQAALKLLWPRKSDTVSALAETAGLG
jgi:hypothetical protein